MSRIRLRGLVAVAALVGVIAWAARAAGQDAGTQRCFLWKVSSKTATVYLLGSMHVAKADLYPLPDEIEDAFAKSAKLVVELDTVSADQLKLLPLLLKKAKYPAGETLSKKLSKDTAELLEKYCAKKKIPAAELEPLRPWFVSMLLGVVEIKALGFGDNGLDKHFLNKAKKRMIPIVELETAESQLDVFTGLSDDFQEKLLAKTLAEVADYKGLMEKITTAWKAGDAKAMNDLMLSRPTKEHPEFKGLMKKMFDDRNVKMVDKIADFLKAKETCFVVVGAAHLVGAKGLVKLLEDKKYDVQQVRRK